MRVAPDERPVVGVEVAEHPAQAELERRRPLGVRPGEPARMEVDVEEDRPASMRAMYSAVMPNGMTPWPRRRPTASQISSASFAGAQTS